MAKDGDRQRGRNCTEQFVKGYGWLPVCRCDSPMLEVSDGLYYTDYKCPKCGWEWTDEQIH